VRARLGFGFSLVFVPFASMFVEFEQTVLLAVILEVIVSITMAVEFRKMLRLFSSVVIKLGSIGGLAIALLSRSIVSSAVVVAAAMAIILATCLLLFLTKDLRRDTERQDRPWELFSVGLASGFLNGWTSLSGPPVILYYLWGAPTEKSLKGALTGYFSLLYVATFAGLQLTGSYDDFQYWRTAGTASVIIVFTYPFIRKLTSRLKGDYRVSALVFIAATALFVGIKDLL
jgi:uncharacterized protein